MFSLILVDDEDFALQGLCNYVDWNSMGFVVAGTAHTIAQALELVRSAGVDVILTDIQLEEESGLDLVRVVQMEYPDIRCVILSGHGEFEYARQALRYSAFDFLTKPVQFDALRHTFETLYRHLSSNVSARDKKTEYYELKRSTFFNNLAKENAAAYDSHTAAELGIQTSGPMQLIRIRFMDDTALSTVLCDLKKAEKHPLEQALAGIGHEIFNNTLNEYAALVYSCPEAVLTDRLEQFAAHCAADAAVGISLPFTGLCHLGRAYYEAGKALDYRLIKRNSSLITFHSVQNNLYTEHIMPETLVASVNECLAQKDTAALSQLLQKELAQLAQYSDSQNIMYSFCVEVILLVERFLRNYAAVPGNFVGSSIHQVVLRTTPADIAACMKQVLKEISAQIEAANPYSSDVVKDMKTYIAEHYAEGITLQSLADQFYLHPIYLSKLFKEKTGENFIDYLTNLRLDSAKQLLQETGIRIYDISQMVGYESPKYFSKIFKEQTGLTPKEYRDAALPSPLVNA